MRVISNQSKGDLLAGLALCCPISNWFLYDKKPYLTRNEKGEWP